MGAGAAGELPQPAANRTAIAKSTHRFHTLCGALHFLHLAVRVHTPHDLAFCPGPVVSLCGVTATVMLGFRLTPLVTSGAGRVAGTSLARRCRFWDRSRGHPSPRCSSGDADDECRGLPLPTFLTSPWGRSSSPGSASRGDR